MSYSFNVRASDKIGAKLAVAAKFDEMVVAGQPIHARDRDAVLTNASTVIDLLADDDTQDIYVACNGYVSWFGNAADTDTKITNASVNCSANHTPRTATTV